MTNLLIDQWLEKEITKHIELKIANRIEKIEILEGIVGSFKETLSVAQPKKIARFKKEYPYLDDMFE